MRGSIIWFHVVVVQHGCTILSSSGLQQVILACMKVEHAVEARKMVRDEASVAIPLAVGESLNKVQHKVPYASL